VESLLHDERETGPGLYEMDPEEQFRVMKDIRQTASRWSACSTPIRMAAPIPSGVDVEKAYWPGTQLPNYPRPCTSFVSLMDRAVPVVKGYTIADGVVTSSVDRDVDRRSAIRNCKVCMECSGTSAQRHLM